MAFVEPAGADQVEATAYARATSAKDVLDRLNYLTEDEFSDSMQTQYYDSIYQNYKVTILIEKA